MAKRGSAFFIVGSVRSGTTMFRLMLNEHSSLCVPPESWFIRDLMNALPVDRVLSSEEVDGALKIVTGHKRFPELGARQDEVRAAVSQLERPCLREIVDAVFRVTCRGKRRWGDKTPGYIRDISRLAQLFPDAKFIHVIRDCRDVCLSLHRVGWKGKNWNRIAVFWRDQVAAGVQQGRALAPGRYIEVRYEDLILDTRAAVARCLEFLGEHMEDAVCDFYESAARNVPSREHRFQEKTMRAPEPSDVGRWQRELLGLQVAAIEFVAGDVMKTVDQRPHFRGVLRAVGLLGWGLIWVSEWSRPFRTRFGLHLSNRSVSAKS